MELIKFLDKNKDCFSFRGIERTCGMSDGLLNKIIKGDRKLNDTHASKIIKLFGNLSLTHVYVDDRERKLPDLLKDGSFGDNWENYFKYFEHSSGLRYKYRKVNDRYYPTEVFDS